jgi:uncharacterized coiled-coil protein SlyX
MNVQNFPPLSGREEQARWPWIAVGVWLLLVSALAIVNSVGLSRLTEQSRASVQDAHVQALATRVGDLEQQAEAVKRQPKPVSQADLDTARQALDERLTRVEEAHAPNDHASEIQALQARVGAIENRLKKSAATVAAAPRHAAEPPKPTVPEPPFNVVGLELRGGERFLSLTVPGATSIRDVRLLREGDTLGAWHLQALEAHVAVFRIEGQTLRIALP